MHVMGLTLSRVPFSPRLTSPSSGPASQVIVLNFISATSMSTLNTFVQAVNIVLGIIIQHTHVTPFLVAGVVIVIVFASLYGVLEANKQVLETVDRVTDTCLKKEPGGTRDGQYTKV